jgi:hypothetical protein
LAVDCAWAPRFGSRRSGSAWLVCWLHCRQCGMRRVSFVLRGAHSQADVQAPPLAATVQPRHGVERAASCVAGVPLSCLSCCGGDYTPRLCVATLPPAPPLIATGGALQFCGRLRARESFRLLTDWCGRLQDAAATLFALASTANEQVSNMPSRLLVRLETHIVCAAVCASSCLPNPAHTALVGPHVTPTLLGTLQTPARHADCADVANHAACTLSRKQPLMRVAFYNPL